MTVTRFFQIAVATVLVSSPSLFAQAPAAPAPAPAEQGKLVSFASTGDCKGAVQYAKGPYNAALDGSHFGDAAQMANDVAEICLNAGDAGSAEEWARMSYAAGMQQDGLKPAESNLLDFRWNATMARIDAMRGDTLAKAREALEPKKAPEPAAEPAPAKAEDKNAKDEKKDKKDKKDKKNKKDEKDKDAKQAKAAPEAAKPAAAEKPKAAAPPAAADTGRVSAKELLAEAETVENRMAAAALALKKGVGGGNPAQLTAFLSGAVAFDQGDFKSAVTDLQQADQADPLVVALLAQAYAKQGDTAQAEQFYQKAAAITAQTPNGAYARLVAQKGMAKK
ncbi:MAG: tetratricopeptide repeat protein, partial [Acidobacteriota bacterium]|nr:tetratricopeptide repeat protein [Acidobacteriota bacterium]